MRKALLIIAFAGLACGSQETSTSPDTGAAGTETPAVSAVQQPAAVQPPSEVTTPEGTLDAAEAVEVTTCLELVQDGKFAEAVVLCQAALNLYPDNVEVADALAKAGAAKAAEGSARAAEGASDAADAAAGAASDAAKGVNLP